MAAISTKPRFLSEKAMIAFSMNYSLRYEPQGASGLLIEYVDEFSFNGKPQATVSGDAVACGSGLND